MLRRSSSLDVHPRRARRLSSPPFRLFLQAGHTILLFISFGLTLYADSQHVVVRGPVQALPSTAKAALEPNSAVITNPEEARKLIRSTILPQENPNAHIPEYVVVHVLRWTDPDKDGHQTVQGQNWYVFQESSFRRWSNEDFTTRNRIYGKNKFYLLYVHLNRGTQFKYDPVYDIFIKQKQSTNVQNVYAAASLFLPETKLEEQPEILSEFWGGREIKVNYVPSDITVTPKVPGIDGLNAQTFDNEGRAHWDISVGVPVRSISETSFDTTSNTVTARTINKQNAYLVLDIYAKPRDLKQATFDWSALVPHPLAGISIRSQPLHRILLGIGVGTAFAEFYAGALLVKQPSLKSLKEGSTATPNQLSQDLQNRYSPQITLGINFPIRAILQRIQKK